MEYIKIEQYGADVIVRGLEDFCLDDILDSGQCFRWEKMSPGVWRGIAFGRSCVFRQEKDHLILQDASVAEFNEIWYDYFDLGRDYGKVKQRLKEDDTMRLAVEFTPGMRVLRQEPWEALCSFILSQNNNIKRIGGLVSRLCENFGEKIEGGFAFPTAERLAAASIEDMAPVRSGFRAGYVLDAARLVSGGEIDFKSLYNMPLETAQKQLQTIRGVGPKVAACALLYGFGRADSVPVDVWIGRALKAFYPNGIPANIADIAGLGQQYLFYYMRNAVPREESFKKQRAVH